MADRQLLPTAHDVFICAPQACLGEEGTVIYLASCG